MSTGVGDAKQEEITFALPQVEAKYVAITETCVRQDDETIHQLQHLDVAKPIMTPE